VSGGGENVNLELSSIQHPFLLGGFPFAGTHLWGSSLLPGDLLMDLEDIRKWAVEANLIWEPESQFLGEEVVSQLRTKFDATDRLEVLAHTYENETRPLNYLESPFVPTGTLIKRQQEVKLVYWELKGITSAELVSAGLLSCVRYGFLVDGIKIELAAEVTARLVKAKFVQLLTGLQGSFDMRVVTEKGAPIAVEITPQKSVRARFFKSGRLHDVQFFL
jgi:hypothetical protein